MLGITKRPVRIMLDPGHGGRDPGAVAPKSNRKESDSALEAALTLKYLINEARPDWVVLMTRYTDTDLVPNLPWNSVNTAKDRMKRMEMANVADCDIFISLHFDTAIQGYRYGCYHTDNPQSIALGKAINRGLKISAGRYTPWLRSQREVRFGALYVRFFNKPSTVLAELGPVRHLDREGRISLMQPIADQLVKFAETK